jgi:hypothetical protein
MVVLRAALMHAHNVSLRWRVSRVKAHQWPVVVFEGEDGWLRQRLDPELVQDVHLRKAAQFSIVLPAQLSLIIPHALASLRQGEGSICSEQPLHALNVL